MAISPETNKFLQKDSENRVEKNHNELWTENRSEVSLI